jgi:dephospho-CoA kinase
MPTIGLTGSFGMGKSTVLRLFKELGAFAFSADDFVHNILENPGIIRKIAKVLGEDTLKVSNGNISINKKRVADIIFSDPHKRKSVENIIHPEVLKLIKLTAAAIKSREPSAIIIFEVPLLLEAGYTRHFNKTIVVYCKRETAITRLTRKGFSKNEVLKRMRSQMPVSEKKKHADYLVDNDNGARNTELQVREIFRELSNPAAL